VKKIMREKQTVSGGEGTELHMSDRIHWFLMVVNLQGNMTQHPILPKDVLLKYELTWMHLKYH
jgi:hypothetical protein